MTFLFWAALILVLYTYLGYGLVLYILVLLKRVIQGKPLPPSGTFEPEITLLVAAYNEKDYISQKVNNTRNLDYPPDKLKQVWITDGSNDGTPDLLREYNDILVLHEDARKGKIAAINRGMKLVTTPIVVFSDANTLLGKESIRRIVNLFEYPTTGCVSGEKRIHAHISAAAASAGEGLYWRYESTLKRWDAELNSVVGAAGELFAVRTELFQHVEADTLLDDFIISLRIAMQGYSIQYDPEAYAIETASANVKEELKRKIRIAAGGIQSIVRLAPLLNIFKYRMLSFQYISHRVLRWTLAPLALPLIFISNLFLLHQGMLYQALFAGQLLFYAAALIGFWLEHRKIKLKILFVPYYFFIMNYAVYRGFGRYLSRKQDVRWERAKRGDLASE